MTLDNAVIQIKQLIENAIRTGGTTAKNNLIRSSVPINLIHEAVKNQLVNNGVQPQQIRPLIGQSQGEVNLYGFLKKKAQDLAVLPTDILATPERVVLGKTDPYGSQFTAKTLSINVRSQLSSAAKNFDTLYERTFAEAINLHERCPNMVLGEVYMIAVREYDITASDQNRVAFKPLDANIRNHVDKYLKYFELLNNRTTSTGDKHKYERVSLILVDFSPATPKIYSTKQELINDGLLDASSTATINNLTFDTIVPTLIQQYQARFGAPSFI